MRYILYARKSEPDEGRQERSIEQQLGVMRQDAQRLGLHVVKTIEEAVSAKVPGKRQGYRAMIEWLKKGRADAILVYHENRLARNPLESGELQQMLQDGLIQEIRTHETVYRPQDNALLFAVISSMSNQYSRDLSTNVRRGMDDKRTQGWFPHRAPEGYRNDANTHTIVTDEERFALLRRAWDLMLTGSYTVSGVLKILNGEWGYTTRPLGKSGGGPLSRTALYRIFGNLFYTGRWMEKGVLYEGKHQPMVSLSEFQQVQVILKRPGKAQRKVHEFAYTGLIRCATCGAAVSGEVQTGRHGKGRYVYYHCANGRSDCRRVSIKEETLERQIDALLQKVTITPEVKSIALKEIRSWQSQESNTRETLFDQQQKALLEAQRKMNRLVGMYLNELFDSDEEYLQRKATLQGEVNARKLEVAKSAEEFARITETAENAFHFASSAHAGFLIGDVRRKSEIARALGISYAFREGAVTITMHPALAAVYRFGEEVQRETRSATLLLPQKTQRIEPLKIGFQSKQKPTYKKSVPLGWPGDTLYQTFKGLPSFPRLTWMKTQESAPTPLSLRRAA